MTSLTTQDKTTPTTDTTLFRMVGQADVDLVREVGQGLSDRARILEIGPFLGGLSVELARLGALTVMDRFIWSDANARDYPDLLAPEESFRPVFERNLAAAGVEATICESDYRALDWPDERFDLCFIDVPRNARDLLVCLQRCVGRLTEGARVMIKHGLSPQHPEMTAFVSVLLEEGYVTLHPTRQAAWCTIAVIEPTAKFASLNEIERIDDILAQSDARTTVLDPWGGYSFAFARLADRALAGNWPAVWQHLAGLPPAIGKMDSWDAVEAHLTQRECDLAQLALLSELLPAQLNAAPLRPALDTVELSPVRAMRAYWRAQRDVPGHAIAFAPELILRAQERGALVLPVALGASVQGAHVLELGPADWLSGLGFLTAGAASYALLHDPEKTPGYTAQLKQHPALTPFPWSRLDHADADLRAALGQLGIVLCAAEHKPKLEPLWSHLPEQTEVFLVEERPQQPPRLTRVRSPLSAA